MCDVHVSNAIISLQWNRYSYEDLNGLDTMIKRMLRKGSEQIVRQFEYYRAAIEQEVNSRGTLRHRRPINQIRRGSASDHPSYFNYPAPTGLYPAPPTSPHPHNHPTHSHTLNLHPAQNHRHTPTYMPSHASHGANGCVHPQVAVYPSYSSSEHSNSSTRTLKARFSDLDLLQDTEETFV